MKTKVEVLFFFFTYNYELDPLSGFACPFLETLTGFWTLSLKLAFFS